MNSVTYHLYSVRRRLVTSSINGWFFLPRIQAVPQPVGTVAPSITPVSGTLSVAFFIMVWNGTWKKQLYALIILFLLLLFSFSLSILAFIKIPTQHLFLQNSKRELNYFFPLREMSLKNAFFMPTPMIITFSFFDRWRMKIMTILKSLVLCRFVLIFCNFSKL